MFKTIPDVIYNNHYLHTKINDNDFIYMWDFVFYCNRDISIILENHICDINADNIQNIINEFKITNQNLFDENHVGIIIIHHIQDIRCRSLLAHRLYQREVLLALYYRQILHHQRLKTIIVWDVEAAIQL